MFFVFIMRRLVGIMGIWCILFRRCFCRVWWIYIIRFERGFGGICVFLEDIYCFDVFFEGLRVCVLENWLKYSIGGEGYFLEEFVVLDSLFSFVVFGFGEYICFLEVGRLCRRCLFGLLCCVLCFFFKVMCCGYLGFCGS